MYSLRNEASFHSEDNMWRKKRNEKLLNTIQCMAERAAASAAYTSCLQAAKLQSEDRVFHLLYRSDPRPLSCVAHSLYGEAVNVGSCRTRISREAEMQVVYGGLQNHLKAAGDPVSAPQSALACGAVMTGRAGPRSPAEEPPLSPPAARHALALAGRRPPPTVAGEWLPSAQLLKAERSHWNAVRACRRRLMLQVWRRELEHRRQEAGPPRRRRSGPTGSVQTVAVVPRRRHVSEPSPETGPWPPEAEEEAEPPPEQPDARPAPPPAPTPPSFPMQHPGKEVEIKESEQQVPERRDNEWTAEWDWAEAERLRNLERAAHRSQSGPETNGHRPAGEQAATAAAAGDAELSPPGGREIPGQNTARDDAPRPPTGDQESVEQKTSGDGPADPQAVAERDAAIGQNAVAEDGGASERQTATGDSGMPPQSTPGSVGAAEREENNDAPEWQKEQDEDVLERGGD